jgi:hypothetical protein
MANLNTPNGLQAVYNSALGPTKITPYYISNAQSAMAIGTPVTLTGTANTSTVIFGQEWPAGTLPGIAVATGGDGNKLLGSIVAFGTVNPQELNPNAVYNPANTVGIALVADSPDQEFTIVDDGTALAVTDIGLNANLTIGAVNTSIGMDTSSLDTSTPAVTATFQLKILRLNNRPNNVIGEANAEYVVRINNHLFGNVTAGV